MSATASLVGVFTAGPRRRVAELLHTAFTCVTVACKQPWMSQAGFNLCFMTETFSLTTAEATLAYDVRGPLPTTGRPPLMMVAAPMDASGFAALATQFPDRTVVTYDPRGIARSARHDGRSEHTPQQNANDLHRIVAALDCGPVDMFAGSGGAVSAMALVATHPRDVAVLVAHEPPLLGLLPDARKAFAAERIVQDIYAEKGWGHGMAAFLTMNSIPGELSASSMDQLALPPSRFGLPHDDDGTRNDPLLSGASNPITGYEPDFAALEDAPTRIVIAVGAASRGNLTGRTSEATAQALGQTATQFPGDHGGYLSEEFGPGGDPKAFAVRLHEVLDRDDTTRR